MRRRFKVEGRRRKERGRGARGETESERQRQRETEEGVGGGVGGVWARDVQGLVMISKHVLVTTVVTMAISAAACDE